MPIRRGNTAAAALAARSSPTSRSPAGAGSGDDSGNEQSRLSAEDIAKKIREGNIRRSQESEQKIKEKTEKEKRMEEEREELVTGIQRIVNFIIALVFVSMPLSEAEIDWYAVTAFILVNLVWNVFLHENTVYHMAILMLLNFTLTQYSEHLKYLPGWAVTVHPLRWAQFLGFNSVVCGATYWFYIRHSKNKEDRTNRLDLASVGILAANLVMMIATGIITMDHINFFFRAMWAVITNLSIG